MNLRPGRSAEAHARGELIWQLLVAALACALYARTVAFGWAFDDSMEVVHNAYVHSLSRFDELVSPRDYIQRVSAWYFGAAT